MCNFVITSIMKNFKSMLFVFFASCLFSKSVNSIKSNKLQCYSSYIPRHCDQRTMKSDPLFNCFKNERQSDIKNNCKACSIATITVENNEQIQWAYCDSEEVGTCDLEKSVHIGTDHFGKITKKITCNICNKDLCNDISKNKQEKSKSSTTKKISSVVVVIVTLLTLL